MELIKKVVFRSTAVRTVQAAVCLGREGTRMRMTNANQSDKHGQTPLRTGERQFLVFDTFVVFDNKIVIE